jgi:hypothetical protein
LFRKKNPNLRNLKDFYKNRREEHLLSKREFVSAGKKEISELTHGPFMGPVFLMGVGYTSNFRLHLHLNEIEIIDI